MIKTINRISLLSCLLLFVCNASLGQINLVINGGFEYDIATTEGVSTDSLKKHYWSYLGDYDTAVLTSISVCHTKIVDWYTSSAPCTDIGFSQPFEGNGFAINNGYNEDAEDRGYLVGTLSRVLENGKKYVASFYIKKAPCAGYEVNLYGISFANRKSVFTLARQNRHPYLSCLTGVRIYAEQKLKAGSYDEWIQVKGEFIADGGEEKIIIGCFRHNNELTVTKHNSQAGSKENCSCIGGDNKVNGSIFIDNVSVESVD